MHAKDLYERLNAGYNYDSMYGELCNERDKLKKENEKLRELVQDLYNRLNDSDEHCGECRSSCNYDAWNFGSPKCIYTKRMHELEIEKL